jgi:ribose-phosphate pyrophosphokinase
VPHLLVIGRDAEREQWVREIAQGVPRPYFVLDNVHHGDSSVVVSAIPEIRRCADRAPVLVDDIISFAATMSETVRQWREAGWAAPVCLGVHSVFAAHWERAQSTSSNRSRLAAEGWPHAPVQDEGH